MEVGKNSPQSTVDSLQQRGQGYWMRRAGSMGQRAWGIEHRAWSMGQRAKGRGQGARGRILTFRILDCGFGIEKK